MMCILNKQDGRSASPGRRTLPHDLLAGLTVGASQVGNAMAYTILAGVPPVHGLYASMVGTPVAALTGSSQRMAVVPTAALCLAAGGALAEMGPEQRVAGLVVLTVLTGAIMLVAGLLRAGALVRFISNAVMIGFMAGVAAQIILGQLGALTGFKSASTNKLAGAADLVAHADRVEVATVTIGLVTVALIVLLKRTRFRYFAMATALVAVSGVVALLGLTSVPVVADIAPIPRSFPLPRLPDVSMATGLILPAVSLAIIGLVQAAGISRSVPNLDGSLGDTSRDFVGQGAANIAGGVFGGGPIGGSVQATALNVGAGSRTRWSAVFAGGVVTVVVLAAAPLVQQVPLAVTAGILLVAATSAVDLRAARDIWRADRLSAAVMLTTFVLVLLIPLQYAVLVGAAISLLKYVYLASLDVHVVEIACGDDGRAREGDAPRALQDDSVTVLDVYGSLFFAAGPKLKQSLPTVGGARRAVVVLRLRGRGTLQGTTIALIRDYAGELESSGGRLYLAGVGPDMQDQLRRTGLLDRIGPDAVLPAGDELYGSCEVARRRGQAWLSEQRGGGASGESGPGDPDPPSVVG